MKEGEGTHFERYKIQGVFGTSLGGVCVVGGSGLLPQDFVSGSLVCLVRPDGTKVVAKGFIQSLTPNPKNLVAVRLEGLTKADVPVNSYLFNIPKRARPCPAPAPSVAPLSHAVPIPYAVPVPEITVAQPSDEFERWRERENEFRGLSLPLSSGSLIKFNL